MTEPDPIAALAAQLEELRGQLLRAEGGVGQVRARAGDDSGQVLMLRLEIKKLGEKIDAAIARREADEPQAPYWLGLSKEEHAARLAELRAWVERVGLVQYPSTSPSSPPCWPSHPAAVIELCTVMTEWVRIYGDPDNRPLQDALVWNDKWLPGVLGRLSRRDQVRRLGLPPGEVVAAGSDRRRATPDRPEGPGVLPLRRGLSASPAALADLHLGLGVARPRLVLPLSVARLPGGLKGRLGLGFAHRGLVNGRLGDLSAFRCPLGILPGQLVHLGAEGADVVPEPGQGLAAVLAALGRDLPRVPARLGAGRSPRSAPRRRRELSQQSPASVSPVRCAAPREHIPRPAAARPGVARLLARLPVRRGPRTGRSPHRSPGSAAPRPRPGPAGRPRPARSARPSAGPTSSGSIAGVSRGSAPPPRPPRRP